ncbi:MAG: rhomboid family intramembrane serine protease [Polyangiaceae bacterium]|nr:rhomboid family intramembrane serine protease [Polyangiaceae bacterium]
MTPSSPGPSRARPCGRCGALNGADFDRCIRCGAPLSALATHASLLGGRLDGQSLLATKVLIVLTCLVFAGQLRAALAHGAFPILPGADRLADTLRSGSLLIHPALPLEPFRLLSAVFVHFGALHFGMNMLALTNLARVAEPAAGSARFAIAYVATGIFGFAASAVWSALVDHGPIHTAGASGAIFGIMGLILGWLVRRRDPRWKQFALQAVVYSLLFGVMVRANNAAHVGGLLAGVVFGIAFAGARRPRAEPLVNLLAALSLAACVAALVLAHLSPLWRSIDADL